MNKKKIELQVLNISNSQAQAGAYALVLGEVGGERQLPIIIGATEAQAMVIEMKGIVPPRPLTHNLFASVLEVLGVKLMRILIYKVDNGVFYSYLYMKAEETILRIDARTSDAVALAHECPYLCLRRHPRSRMSENRRRFHRPDGRQRTGQRRTAAGRHDRHTENGPAKSSR